jgi:hypothetical protein
MLLLNFIPDNRFGVFVMMINGIDDAKTNGA